MPLKLIQRGEVWYIRGTVGAGKESRAVYETTRLRDKKLAAQYRRKREAEIVRDMLEPRTFADAAKAHGERGGSLRFVDRLSKHFGKRDLSSIRQVDLEAAGRAIYPDCSRETVNRQVFTPFIAVWNCASINQWVPVRKWQRPRKPKGTRIIRAQPTRAGSKPTTYDQAAKFVEAMSPAAGMLMTFLFYTGMRPIEAFMLEATDVNVPGRWVSLSHTKTGEPRGVPMHEFLVPLLEALVGRGGRVFRTQRGLPYEEKDEGGGQMKSAILGARRRSKVPGISPYTARHTVSTQLVVNGVHPHIKDQILGHAVDDMSRHYTNVPQKPLIEAINTLPVSDSWRALEWWEDPIKATKKLAKGTGKRTDLKK
ncbi:tyrosine-type recombinase/integrase [Labrys neptuniae]|uniref:tyrosine-type recombinase/integrase n=1 Tax=Labrys neptuniae TaxID=376174 RepID=UPI0028913E7D|nr:tyrosine-type recombinase/integrase [Labrys neptuniae]MDT3382528.1 tyrosine-type recombinase/integrase [Labrys neptuniae]